MLGGQAPPNFDYDSMLTSIYYTVIYTGLGVVKDGL